MKFFIIILFIFSLFIAPIFVFADCSKTGTTVIFINGIWENEAQARSDKQYLEYQYKIKGESKDVNFINGYNPIHVFGLDDLVSSIMQAYGVNGVDYDLTNILLQAHIDLKTQKILLVGHSQGTFYTNIAYDYLTNHGVDKNSIAVYNVATPASKVAGNGKYLTSSTDEVINSIVRQLATAGNANKPLPANITINIPKNIPDPENGHSFSNVYLGLAPDRIIGEMDTEINNLTANSDKSECFTAPKTDIIYNIQAGGYYLTDNVGKYGKYAATSPETPSQMASIANFLFQGIYNFGQQIASGVSQVLAQNKFWGGSLSSSLPQNTENNPQVVSNISAIPPAVNIPAESPVVIATETISPQDQLDDIQEKLDIISAQVQALVAQQNSNIQLAVADKNQATDDKNDQDQNNNQNTNNTTNKSSSGSGSATIYPKILISEVQIDPIGQRFVEFYNPNSTPVDLTDWYLQRKDSNDISWGTFVSSTNFAGKIISANGYFLISRQLANSDILSDITLSDDNSLALKNPNGEISDKLGFGNAIDPELLAIGNPASGQSIGRKVLSDGTEQDTDNNSFDFEIQTPTPKAQNKTYVQQSGGGGDGSDNTTISITTYTISNPTISPDGDGVNDTTSIDLAFSEEVKADVNIINSDGVKVRDLYSSSAVKNPDAKIWDGKDNFGAVVPNGVYTISVAIADSAGNSITDTSKTITVDDATPPPATPTLLNIAITTPATKLYYNIGDTLDLTGLVVTETYSDGSHKVVSISASDVTGFDSSISSANQPLTITFGGQTATYAVNIVSSNFSITPDGMFLSHDNIFPVDWLNANYAGCNTLPTAYSLTTSGFDLAATCLPGPSPSYLTVLVHQTTTSFVYGPIYYASGVWSTMPPAPASLVALNITTPATKLYYNVNDPLDLTGLVVTGTYSDGTKQIEPITSDDVTGFNSAASAADQVLTITFDGQSANYKIDIVSKNFTITSAGVIISHDDFGFGFDLITTYSNCTTVPTINLFTSVGLDLGASCAPASLPSYLTARYTENGVQKGFVYGPLYYSAGVWSAVPPPPAPTLLSIAITNPANKFSYTVGDTLDLTGLIVTGTYSDLSTHTETVNASNITGFDNTTPSLTEVLTITINGVSTNYNISMAAAPATQLKIISLPQTITAGNSSDVFTVESQNASGELMDVSTKTPVNLSSNSPTGLFSLASASSGLCDSDWTKKSITISTGKAHESFCYKDSI